MRRWARRGGRERRGEQTRREPAGWPHEWAHHLINAAASAPTIHPSGAFGAKVTLLERAGVVPAGLVMDRERQPERGRQVLRGEHVGNLALCHHGSVPQQQRVA